MSSTASKKNIPTIKTKEMIENPKNNFQKSVSIYYQNVLKKKFKKSAKLLKKT